MYMCFVCFLWWLSILVVPPSAVKLPGKTHLLEYNILLIYYYYHHHLSIYFYYYDVIHEIQNKKTIAAVR